MHKVGSNPTAPFILMEEYKRKEHEISSRKLFERDRKRRKEWIKKIKKFVEESTNHIPSPAGNKTKREAL